MQNDIQGRKDIEKLIHVFYAKVRKDELLGPIFLSIIHDWDHHMAHIADFWERNLFGSVNFYGNPGRKHMDIDDKQGNTIQKEHFDTWLRLFYETTDALFSGGKADEIKQRATSIGANFLRMMMNNRSRKLNKTSSPKASGFQFGGSFLPEK